MRPVWILIFDFLVFLISTASGQIVSSSVPQKISKSEKFLFYLHGGVVTVLGNNAINQAAPEWGPYEYLNILDALRTRGFNVISEIRKQGVEDSVYAIKIAKQLDTLFRAGVKADSIILVGASAGSNIVLLVSDRMHNGKMKYVIMGGCWPDAYKQYTTLDIRGRFLSIFENSDPHKTCIKIFDERKNLTNYKEIELHTGLSHGFIYKGRKEWLDPIVDWFATVP